MILFCVSEPGSQQVKESSRTTKGTSIGQNSRVSYKINMKSDNFTYQGQILNGTTTRVNKTLRKEEYHVRQKQPNH